MICPDRSGRPPGFQHYRTECTILAIINKKQYLRKKFPKEAYQAAITVILTCPLFLQCDIKERTLSSKFCHSIVFSNTRRSAACMTILNADRPEIFQMGS